MENKKQIAQIENILLKSKRNEVLSFSTRIGMWADEIKTRMRDNWSVIYIDLTPYGKRKRVAREIVEELRTKIKNIKNFKSINFNIVSGGPPVGRPIDIQIVGADDKIRNKLAKSVEKKLKSIKGVKDIENDQRPGKEEIQLLFNYEKLSRLGLNLPNSCKITQNGV